MEEHSLRDKRQKAIEDWPCMGLTLKANSEDNPNWKQAMMAEMGTVMDDEEDQNNLKTEHAWEVVVVKIVESAPFKLGFTARDLQRAVSAS